MADRIFFFDFDDTLYSHANRCVPASTRRALLQLMENGEPIVIATGRAPDSINFIQTELDIPFEWMIVLNGQMIYHNGSMVYEKFITLPSIREVYEIAHKNGFACGGFYQDGSLVSEINERVKTVWNEFGSPLPREIPNFLEQFALYQAHLYVTVEEAKHYFSSQTPDYVVNWSHPTLMNLISRETGKSKGIEWILEKFGVKRENTYAFGDGFNDVDMLTNVGHGIAMGNASMELQRVAEFVTGTPEEDGILRALEHYGIL